MSRSANSSVSTEVTVASNSSGDELTVRQTTYTIADLGIRANPQTQQTIIGPRRSVTSLTRYEWIYLTLSLASLLVLFGLTAERLITLKSSEPDFTFAFLLSWTTLFCFVYVWQGIFRERPFELLAYVATILIVFIYVIINFTANPNRTDIKITRLVITCLFGPVFIIGGLYFAQKYSKSKNLIYRTVGANVQMQRICEVMFAEESLLKFDAQLAGSSLILWLRKGFSLWQTEDIIVVSIGSFVTFIWVSIGFLAMRFENKSLIYVFFITSVFEPSIIIWNLVRYSLGPDDTVLEVSVFMSAIIALIVRILTVVVMTFVLLNFGKGLKQKVFGLKDEINDRTINQQTTNS